MKKEKKLVNKKYIEKMIEQSLMNAICKFPLDGINNIVINEEFWNKSGELFDNYFRKLGINSELFVKDVRSGNYEVYTNFVLNYLIFYQLADIKEGIMEFNELIGIYQSFINNCKNEAIFLDDCYYILRKTIKTKSRLERCIPIKKLNDNFSNNSLEKSSYRLVKRAKR